MPQSRTIANVIPEVNESIFLPPIQREFVWKKEQIKKLFDSVLRGYPIGSFLFWNIREENVEDKIKYKFIKDYIDEPKYPHGLKEYGTHRNKKVDEKFEELPNNITLVLDGQQRLTSFYMGLTGTYTDKKPYCLRDKEENWRRKKLYLNLFNNPKNQDGKLNMKYDFKFKKPNPPQTENNYWFEIENILEYEDEFNLRKDVKSKIKNELELDTCPNQDFIDRNLNKLFYAIHKDEIITYFEEESTNEDRILDIFIRANEAGTKLSKPNMVLSMASSVWKESDNSIVAREEIHNFIDKLNSHESRGAETFDVRFVLQSLLACSKEPLSFSYKNFNSESRLKNMKSVWLDDDFEKSVLKTLDLISEFKLSMTYLSKNSIIPIIFFVYNKSPSFDWNDEIGNKNRKRVLYLLLTSMLNDVYQSKVPQVIQAICETINNVDSKEFPLEEIQETFNRYEKSLLFNKNTITEKFNKYNYESNKKTKLMLYLLYFPKTANNTMELEMDHIFPKSKLNKDDLIDKNNIDFEQANKISNKKDRIGNLQLIPKHSNRKKNDKSFDEWIESRVNDSKNYIPENKELYKIEKFIEFIEKREEEMIHRISKNISKLKSQ